MDRPNGDPVMMEHGQRLSRRLALRRLGQGGLVATGAAVALAAAPGVAAQSEGCTCGGDAAAGTCACPPPEPIVPAATLETLPETTAETAGRLRYLTDYDRGLWLDLGGTWVDQRGHVFDVRAYGAVGDGATDDWAAFHSAIEAMTTTLAGDSNAPYGHTLLVPAGVYRLSQTLKINRSIRLVGSGAGGRFAAILRFDPGVAGIVVVGPDPGRSGLPGRTGEGTIIEKLRVEAESRLRRRDADPLAADEDAPVGPTHGIQLEVKAAVIHCAVVGFPNDGIRVEVPDAAALPGAAGWHVEACEVAACGGHGLGVSRVSGGSCTLLDALGNGGFAIADDSIFGNTYVQCRANDNGDGGFTTTGGTNRSVFVGCVATTGRSTFANQTIVVGGDYPAQFVGGNAWTATASRVLLQAQDPGSTEPALPTAPTLHLRGAETQTQPHLLVSDAGDGRLAEFDVAGRLFIGPADPTPIVGEGGPVTEGGPAPGTVPVLLQLSHPESGRPGVRWLVLGEGGGFVAQLRAFRDVPGPDAGPDAPAVGGARLTFQTAGPSGQELDTLTLREGRAGMGTLTPHPTAILDLNSTTQGFLPPRMTSEQRDAIASPAEGLVIYNATTRRLNFRDNEGWREVARVEAEGETETETGG